MVESPADGDNPSQQQGNNEVASQTRSPLIESRSTGGERLFHLALLLALFFLARHLHHGGFGFYEDDYTLVVRGMAAPWAEVRDFAFGVVERFSQQGRPLQHGPVILLGHLAGRLGGRAAAYWIGYGMVAVNILLAYLLFERLAGRRFALLAGLAYALFSADTTQAFLYHAFGLQPALTFLLLAYHAYLSRRQALPYLLILGSLLSYESVYPLFMAAPLLERRWDARWRRRAALHLARLLVIMLVVVGLRSAVGEGRVGDLAPGSVVGDSGFSTLVGPLVALGSFALRPLQALRSLDLEIGLASLAAAALVYWAVARGRGMGRRRLPPLREAWKELGGVLRSGPGGGRDARGEPSAQRLAPLVLAGLAMLALAYPLTFTVRPYAISGRDTRVHFAAVVGAALVWGGVWALVLASARQTWIRRLAMAGLAALMGLHVGFGLVVQRDYERAWRLQSRFWSSLVDTIPDVSDGTVVFVEPSGLEDTQYIDANTWNLPLVPQYVYRFPEDWQQEPRVFRLAPPWPSRSVSNPLEVKLIDVRFQYITVPKENAVFLETEAGEVVGRLDQIEVQGRPQDLRPVGSLGEPPYPPGILYPALIDGGTD